ncbi:MAG: penicillin-binding protein activator LpoB [Treponema sp.]|jgi:hypothetical protein|nr:penicillin-binding protein activator LpoB [Treponema sp.]
MNKIQSLLPVNDNQSEVIVIFDADDFEDCELYVYIDGVKKIEIDPNERRRIIVSNGSHLISVDCDIDEDVFVKGETIRFNANSGRYLFTAELKSELLAGKRASLNHPERYTFELLFSSDEAIMYENRMVAESQLKTITDRAYEILSGNIPENAALAFISTSSGNNDREEFIVDELVMKFVNSSKYNVVDRKTLDIIRKEQNFQLSGDVNDDSIVSIGHLIGAEIIITVGINNDGMVNYLRIKALDVETAKIRAMFSEQL